MRDMEDESKPELGVEDYLAMLPPEGQQVIQKELKRLKDLAGVDPLTEAYNRRGLTEQIGNIAEMVRKGELSQVVVLVGDIDKFKEINDGLSHKFGDDLLRMISDKLREDDIVGRIGGDEFMMILPVVKGKIEFTEEILETRLDGFGQSLEGRRQRMADSLPKGQKWPMVGEKPAGTVSFGGRIFSGEDYLKLVEEGGDVIANLTEDADLKMYMKKN